MTADRGGRDRVRGEQDREAGRREGSRGHAKGREQADRGAPHRPGDRGIIVQGQELKERGGEHW